LEKHVSSLHKHKDDIQKDFEKVEGQAKYCLMFIAIGDVKLSQLQLELDA
jgi:DNA anti-recombination protein RmuC